VVAKAHLAPADLRAVPEGGMEQIQRTLRLAPQMRTLLGLLEVETSEDDIAVLAGFWGAILLNVFTDQGILDTGNLAKAFKGVLQLPDGMDWVYLTPELFHDVVVPAIQFGVICAYMASASAAPERRDGVGDEDFFREVIEWFDDIDRTHAACNMNSREFEREFFLAQKKLIAVEASQIRAVAGEGVAVAQNEVLRFVRAEKEWDVFRIDQVTVHALWANEIRNILFHGQCVEERPSIASNPQFLNNMILQSCDSPIGYPALTSPFIESLINPMNVGSYAV
jgi:hypothetical protein